MKDRIIVFLVIFSLFASTTAVTATMLLLKTHAELKVVLQEQKAELDRDVTKLQQQKQDLEQRNRRNLY